MKKLLCIVCLLATVLFVNAADAAIGSPARNGRSTFRMNTVRVSTACTTCGRTVVRPVAKPVVKTVVRPIHHHVSVRPVHHHVSVRPIHHHVSVRPVHHHVSVRPIRHHVFARPVHYPTVRRYSSHLIVRSSKPSASCTRCA